MSSDVPLEATQFNALLEATQSKDAKKHEQDAKQHGVLVNTKQCDPLPQAKQSDSDVILSTRHRKRFLIKAACRCLSFYFFGSESDHLMLRSLLKKFVEANRKRFTALVFTENFDEHM